ncbi:MAG TPA: hypothetical protein VGL82_00820 [Bryobacteraceae bacterium]
MTLSKPRHVFPVAVLIGLATVCYGQALPAPPAPIALPDEPNAQRVRAELGQLLQRYPPSLREVLQIDPGLFENQGYLAAYPALGAYLKDHPEVSRNPGFYVGMPEPQGPYPYSVAGTWRDIVQGLETLLGVIAFFGLVGWFSRTLIDYRRWNRQNKVLTDVHTKLLDRLTGNEDLLSYIQSPAGSRFLESSPIRLDSSSQYSGAPVGRILWTIQAGVVLGAAGVGLLAVAKGKVGDVAEPLHALGILSLALGAGFVISAIISFIISRRLGILELPQRPQS